MSFITGTDGGGGGGGGGTVARRSRELSHRPNAPRATIAKSNPATAICQPILFKTCRIHATNPAREASWLRADVAKIRSTTSYRPRPAEPVSLVRFHSSG